jgi:hypothetical protein
VTYTVRNSENLSASVTREVRILEPKVTITRTPYSFSGQGKAGAKFNYNVKADAEGMMSMTVGGLNKTTVQVKVIDSTGSAVLTQSFPGNATKEFWVAEGSCFVEVSIIEGNGNVKFDLSFLTPEVVYHDIAQEEVPLAGGVFNLPQDDVLIDNNNNSLVLFSAAANGVLIVAVGILVLMLAKKRKVQND